MRGYGSWSIGWREAENKSYKPDNSGNGCLLVFFGLIVLTSFKVAIETGNFLAFLIGLAVIAGCINGLNKTA
jgi:hypothetical protein